MVRMLVGNIERGLAEDIPDESTNGKIIPRVIGSIGFLSSLWILKMAINRRSGLFHRLAIGVSTHYLLASLAALYGPAAAPTARFGSTATCNLQGFVIYVSVLSTYLYYASFSVCSYFGVRNNFETSKINWVEKYIHLIINICLIATGIYLLVRESLNYNERLGLCVASSFPYDCQKDPDIPCERGPESWMGSQWTLIAPQLVTILSPTVIMTVLILGVRKRKDEIYISAKAVALQAILYLFPIYLCVLPQILGWFIPQVDQNTNNVTFYIIQANYAMFGFWCLLVYWYFSVESKTPCQWGRNKETTCSSDSNEDAPQTQEPDDNNGEPTQELTSRRYSFNIFDGTNASGAFAQFVHEGDSDDEANDEKETDHWRDVQDHI